MFYCRFRQLEEIEKFLKKPIFPGSGEKYDMNICKVKYKIIFRRRVILYRFASKTSCAVGFDLEEHHLLLALQ